MTKLQSVLLAALCAAIPLHAGAQQTAVARRVILLVDSSTAIQPHFQRIRTALNAFIEALPEDTEIALVSTGGQYRVRVAPTADRAKLKQGADAFSPDGGANAFLDAMMEADRRLLKNAPERRPVFVIVTTDSESRSDPRIDDYNRFMNDFLQRGGKAHAVVIRNNHGAGLAVCREPDAEHTRHDRDHGAVDGARRHDEEACRSRCRRAVSGRSTLRLAGLSPEGSAPRPRQLQPREWRPLSGATRVTGVVICVVSSSR